MQTMVHLGLHNARAAAVLAVVPVILARLLRRPALMHAVLPVILLKRSRPPLYGIALLLPSYASSLTAQTKPSVASESMSAAASSVEPGEPPPAPSENDPQLKVEPVQAADVTKT